MDMKQANEILDQAQFGEYHTFIRDNRKAIVLRNAMGFYVELYQRDVSHFDNYVMVERRDLYKHAELYAENCAENWVDGVI